MAGELRVSMLFQANAAQAKAEVAALRAETTKLGQGAAAAGQGAAAAAPLIGSVGDAARTTAADMIGAADGAAEWGSYVQMVRAQVQPLVGEAQALAAGMQQLALMEEMGALSAHEGALAHDMLSRKATELMGRMEAAGVSIDGTTAAMRRQDSETQQLINRMTGVSSATEMTIADTLRHGQALDDLRARYNPLFAASRQYEVELHNIAEAERLGALATNEAAQARDRAALSLAPIPGQLGRVGAASGAATASLAQLGYQVSDIGMMMSMGQSPFMLMMQQGPQVVQAFDLMKQSGVSLGVGLRSALMGMISPMSLATMGAIGLSAVLVQWLTDSAGATANVERLTRAYDDLSAASTKVQMKIDKLRFGVDEDFQVELLQQQIRLQAEFNAKKGELSAYEATTTDSIDRQRISTEALKAEISAIAKKYNENVALLTDQENRTVTLAVIEGQRAQAAGEAAARQREGGAAADAMMAHHQQEARMVALIAQYGADSLEVAYARASAERQVYEAQLAAQGIVGETADDLLRAWDAAEGIAAVNMAAGIGAAAGQAQLLASALGVSLAKAVAIMGLANKAPKVAAARVSFGGVGSAADGIIPGGSAGLTWGDNPGSHQSTFDGRWPDTTGAGGGGGGGGGGGAGAAQKEASAVKRLVDEQRRQIEALRILDPVQAEIAKNHEALAKATTAEREQVIELIKERMRLEEVRDRLQEIEQAGKNAFVGLVTGAQSFSEAVSNILMKLAEMAASDAWDLLWSGGSGGGAGLGGLVAEWLGLGVQANAEGGHISGPGGPKDDAILSWLSNGEFVVNAAATQGALPLLEALNAGVPIDHLMQFIGGSMPAFADGGMVAPRASSPQAWFGAASGKAASASMGASGSASQAGGGGEVAVRLYFDSRKSDWVAEIERVSGNVATEKVIEGIGAFSNHLLPARMAEISDNPRIYG